MCDFCSWVELPNGRIKYLSKRQLETKRGKAMVERIGTEDLCGHGAIREYWGLERVEGRNKECTDFSSPDNFPPEIAKALKDGDFEGVGIAQTLLTKPAWAEYDKVCQTARAEYDKVCQTAFWRLFAKSANRNPRWR